MADQLYIDDGGEVYATQAPGTRQMTPDEIEAHLNPKEPPITAEALKAIVTAYRWEVETGGLILDGVKVGTTVADQNRIVSVLARNRGIDTFDFEAQPTVWVTMTRERLEAIDQAIAQHVQACFTAARRHHEAIDALVELHKGNLEGMQLALDAYDETQGWPEVSA